MADGGRKRSDNNYEYVDYKLCLRVARSYDVLREAQREVSDTVANCPKQPRRSFFEIIRARGASKVIDSDQLSPT